MGCTTSKEQAEAPEHAGTWRPRSLYKPPPPVRPPTPPRSITGTRKRKASNPYLENPQRKWQRRQMGDELFGSGQTTPERFMSVPLVESPPLPRRSMSRNSIVASLNEKRECDDYHPGTALPYAPSSHPSTPQQASSLYSEHPVTPLSENRQSHTYRSYSGRMMYSPTRFPASSSPYGTPTIRVVPRSTSRLAYGLFGNNKDDDAKTWLIETTVDDDTFQQLGCGGDEHGNLGA